MGVTSGLDGGFATSIQACGSHPQIFGPALVIQQVAAILVDLSGTLHRSLRE